MLNHARTRRWESLVVPYPYLSQQMEIHRAEGDTTRISYLKALKDWKRTRRALPIENVPEVIFALCPKPAPIEWEDFWVALAEWLLDHDPASARFLFSLIKAFRLHEGSARGLHKYPEFLATPEQQPFRGFWPVLTTQQVCNDRKILNRRLAVLRRQIIEFGHDARPHEELVGDVA